MTAKYGIKMKKQILGFVATTLMASSVLAGGSKTDYTLTVTLMSENESQLVSAVGSGGNMAELVSIPVKHDEPYTYNGMVFGEIHTTAKCGFSGEKLTMEPSQVPVFVNFEIDGRWSKSDNEALLTAFAAEIKDINEVTTLGRISDDCSAESVTKKGVKASGNVYHHLPDNMENVVEVGNGYKMKFELKEQ